MAPGRRASGGAFLLEGRAQYPQRARATATSPRAFTVSAPGEAARDIGR